MNVRVKLGSLNGTRSWRSGPNGMSLPHVRRHAITSLCPRHLVQARSSSLQVYPLKPVAALARFQHGCNLERLCCDQTPQPVGAGSGKPVSGDHAHGAKIRQALDIPVAHLRNRSRLFLAATRMRPGREPRPGGSVTSRPEARYVRRRCSQHAGGDGPDTGHCPEPTGCLVNFPIGFDLSRHDIDARTGVAELASKEVKWHLCLCRQIGSFGPGDKTAHVVNAFRDDNAELTQMCTDGVGQLCQLTDAKVAWAMLHQHGLLPFGLDRHELRIVGRVTAVQIAAASAASVLP